MGKVLLLIKFLNTDWVSFIWIIEIIQNKSSNSQGLYKPGSKDTEIHLN